MCVQGDSRTHAWLERVLLMVIQGQFINKASERQTLVNKPIPTAFYSLFPFCFDQLNELNEVRLLFLRIAALQ